MGAAKLPIRRASPKVDISDSASPLSELSNDSTEKERRRAKIARASKPKVRTGCVTCKIRRVKCDEVKPSCNRCTSTGRTCDGYYIPPRKNRRIDHDAVIELSTTPERCLEVVAGTGEELRALEFFHARTAPNLSSYFDAGFWTRLVFQVSHVEPAIMHAMVAVGHLNQRRDVWTKPLPMLKSVFLVDDQPNVPGLSDRIVVGPTKRKVIDHDDPFALSQYNKAISLLSQRIRDPDAASEIALLACILFVCIEFLRGDVEPAFRHFKSGMGIAKASLTKSSLTKPTLTMELIREGMLPFFNRLEVLAMLFGQAPKHDYHITIDEAVPAHFSTMQDARDSIVHLSNIGLRFIRNMKKGRYARLVLPDDFVRQAVLEREVERWKEALDALILTDTVSLRDLDAAKVLRVHQIILTVWLGSCCHIADSYLDNFMADFEAGVTLGEEIQRNAATIEQRRTNQPSFLFDMELVSPLYYIAIKCRDPNIRRRAIALLRQTRRREGLWDSNMAAAIAERIAALEEVNLSTLDGSELPAEEDRVHNTEISTMVSENPHEHTLRYYSKAYGLDKEFKVWTERIVLEMDPGPNTRPELLY
ncbi:hypothetical protein LTR56_024776 [Elasticomyces elasticus]|nr:hypothetical protein LTR56_024776 [Elasticomyces elasticus]KAK3622066.1 hypothetical protein LTR22_024955 [Elasticomyces elasticus]KAK4905246.1 hypothetical protein LTR49_025436 [Elasticomyces elasticus]KAK5747653.1 hypothetical protein LTS12_022309 [Elasticomyces elasticus]